MKSRNPVWHFFAGVEGGGGKGKGGKFVLFGAKLVWLQKKPFDLIENLDKLMFTHSPFRLIKLPNSRLLEEQQFFVYSHIIVIIFSQNSYHFLSKMSALNKTESQIWRQYMNLSLHSLSLSPNRHYDHVLFFRPSLWVLMRYSFDTWKESFRVC